MSDDQHYPSDETAYARSLCQGLAIVAPKCRAVRSVQRVDRDGHRGTQDPSRVPPASRDEQRLARMELKADAFCLVGQREFRRVRIEWVVDPGLVRVESVLRVQKPGLLRTQSDVFLVAVQLHQESMSVKA